MGGYGNGWDECPEMVPGTVSVNVQEWCLAPFLDNLHADVIEVQGAAAGWVAEDEFEADDLGAVDR